MSTLRVSNIEAKADASSPTINEKVKVTNSNGDVLLHLDGETSGIGNVGVGTTGTTFSINNSTQAATFTGTVTSPSLVGPLTGNVTGNVTGNLTGNVTGNVTGSPTISGISSSISDTAVDIFIYDTSKDSDGGAWRQRTSHTSWYNETLNTATRGSRREFPAVAVIVATATGVTIYDGDDPDMPMWMVFNSPRPSGNNGEQTMLGCNGDTPSSCSALNGNISVGEKLSYGGLVEILFVSDTARRRRGSYGGNGTHGYWVSKSISTRNTGNTGTGRGYDDSLGSSTERIVTDNVNDVAMTVLPNAPIDDATGLPIPTIAVATNGGVSVIKDDGAVVDTISSNSGYTFARSVAWSSNNDLLFVMGSSAGNLDYFHTYDGFNTSDNTITIDSKTGSTKNVRSMFRYAEITLAYGDHWFDAFTVQGTRTSVSPDYAKSYVTVKGDAYEYAIRSPQGLTHISENPNSRGSLVSYATTSHATGWLHGDIKGAFLSDTDATNVTGSNLIDNGDFGTGDFTNWSIGGSTTPTISSGGALLTAAVGIDGYVWQSTSGESTSGKWVITWTVTQINGGFLGLLLNTTQPVNSSSYSTGGLGIVLDGITTSGSYYYEGNITSIEFRHRGGSSSIIDNISLRRVESDRSVNNKGLQVFGTVTKSAVATGAELVGYSGFSANNYLKKPYDANINFGTNDFSIILWCKSVGNGNQQTFISNLQGTGSDGYYLMRYNDSGNWYFGTATGGSGLYTDLTKGYLTDGIWHCLCVTKSGGYANLYQDGKHILIDDVKSDVTVSTSTELKFSRFTDSNNLPLNGSMALVRISGSIPSPEQIKKIYEDEKVLFQENAACTLHGSSDAVTALAYDDSTNLLYAGTSSGRSDFQGLRRINNTTTAVTTAISASNGLVAEQ